VFHRTNAFLKAACGIEYAEAATEVVLAEVQGVKIPFASPRLLWRMKQTYREKDAFDRLYLAGWFHDRGETPPRVPPGAGVLVFGLDAKAARARAATFARAGNRPVLVFIPRDADERGRFYAVASRRQEERRGKDS